MIIIPMAGLSRRFALAGYEKPKYMLPLPGGTVFAHAIRSFSTYFAHEAFLFIARDVDGTHDFIRAECAALGVAQAAIEILAEPTAGQAETVALGLLAAGTSRDTPITIFNIDTFRPGFRFPSGAWFGHSAGYLEVFRGSGANWSYVRPAPGDEPRALETAEKRAISELCCTGLYHFAAAGGFLDALAQERLAPSSPELYVAPLYNHLIASGKPVHYEIVPADEIIFCGVPAEYEALLK